MRGLHGAEASRMSSSVASHAGDRSRPEIWGREAMSRACVRVGGGEERSERLLYVVVARGE